MSASTQFQLRRKQAGSPQDESPPEVFYLISSSIIGDDETLIQEKLSSLRALCLVCRRWRDMVYGEPRLWTSAKVYWDDFPERPSPPSSSMLERRAENFKRFFSRSGNMPLTLHLRWNEYGGCVAREAMQSITSIDRWETISIQFEGKGAAYHEKAIEHKLYALAYMKDGHSYFRNVQKFSLRDHGYLPVSSYRHT
ncbi:hypothetical protein BKA70DRAFT_579030 [Coprinopsis sp. MPI-PUGE-AT-0042]|nr:hypothetical protein BKA70DRAFT_579030 [Coprinopsis sp. MPI-PUGE-AT-0042]